MLGKLVILTVICTAIIAKKCPDDERCAWCEGTTCKGCAYGYLSGGECMAPDDSVENCVSYSNATTCSDCDFGYDYNSTDKKCVKIDIANCDSLNPVKKTDCLICGNKVEAKDGKCDAGNTKCPDNCDRCTEGVCIWCSSGYSLNTSFACIKEPTANCFLTEVDETKCSVCLLGYYDNEGTCKKGVSSAAIMSVITLFISWIVF